MSSGLTLAILSMDAYNRGYGVRIRGLSDEIGRLGSATILSDSIGKLGASAELAGFYAIAYNVNGETIISYRGTDNLTTLGSAGDVWSYGIGAGDPYNLSGPGSGYGTAVGLTIDFYKAVLNGRDPFAQGAVTLTGHSLGGGLAGYVAGLYGQRAVIFDNMTFNQAVYVTQHDAATGAIGSGAEALRDLIYGNGPITDVNYSNIAAFATTDGSWSSLIARLKSAAGVDFNTDELTELVKLGWGKAWGAGIGADNVDRFHMAARTGLATVALAERSYTVPTIAGGEANDNARTVRIAA